MSSRLLCVGGAILAVSFGACGAGDVSGPLAPATTSQDPIRESLVALGVPVSDEPRIDDEGNDLPEDWTPLGGTVEFGKVPELMLFGNTLNGGPAGDANVAFFEAAQDKLLHHTHEDAPNWIDERNSQEVFAQTTRAAAAGDINGDGREEAVIVYIDRENPNTDQELRVHTFGNQESSTPFAEDEQVIKLVPNVKDINIALGDINGDGADDLIVGLSNGAEARLHFFENIDGLFVEDTSAQLTFAPTLGGNSAVAMSLRIVTGNLDYDRSMETAIVVNEYSNGVGASRYFVFDDATTEYAELDSDIILVNDAGAYVASVADIAIGDVDGDTLGEVVLGGLGGYVDSQCSAQNMLGLVLDDAKHGLAVMAQHQWDYRPSCRDFDPLKLRFVEVNTLDVDADFVDEFSIHGFVFNSLKDSQEFTTVPGRNIPDEAWIDGSGGYIDRSTASVHSGDFTGDGKEDLAVYSQEEGIRIYGPSHLDGRWGLRRHIDTRRQQSFEPQHGILLPVNLDNDTQTLRYASEYKLVFTEPLLVAAMSAPPCMDGIGQNTSDCRTSFGSASSNSSASEQSFSVTGSVTAGFKVTGGAITQSEASMKATFAASATRTTGSAYTLTKSVQYTSGPQEDTVIFTTIPYDQYTYEVLSHPNPDMIGKEIVLSQPRSPITLMVEREFYNSVIPEGSPRVDAKVFQHLVGDVDSYPTRAEKNTLLSRYGGLEGNVESVGQGSGFVTTALSVNEEFSTGQSLSTEFSLDVEATAGGILGGFSVGFGTESSLTITTGTETAYAGSVGNLPAERLGDTYNYGLFTYVQQDPATLQKFEVINYWVE